MLQTGAAPRVLGAVEETPGDVPQRTAGLRRRIRSAADLDRALAYPSRSRDALADFADYDTPIRSAANDGRPVSFGVRTIADLHTARQLAYLTAARRWLDDSRLDPLVAPALSLAVSSTVTSNNLDVTFQVRAFLSVLS